MDPFAILEVSYSAAFEEIQSAFRKKMESGGDTQLFITAYGMIRDPVSRRKFLWGDIRACFAEFPQSRSLDHDELLGVIREVAFLTDWELGDDSCLKMSK